MTNQSIERQIDPKNLEDDFELAFKLVFFDENDEQVEPVQYRPISNFTIEREVSSQ